MAMVREATLEDALAIGQVRAESWQATYRGIVPYDFLDTIDPVGWGEQQRRCMINPPDGLLDLVAVMGSRVVGWASGGRNREPDSHFQGELYAIYILPVQQRQGIGSKLVRAVAQHLVTQGMHSMVVWVLAANLPARRFYEAHGGRLDSERLVPIGGTQLLEVSYGWENLDSITSSPTVPPGS